MPRKYYLLAIAALLAIPVVTFLGFALVSAINPEIAAGHENYVWNFWLLTQIKQLLFRATLLIDCILWLLCCVFVLKAKAQSIWWLGLAIFGPFGLAALAMLGDRKPGAGPSYLSSLGWKRLPIRAAYEAARFVLIWMAAYQAMVLWRNFLIRHQSIVTGTPVKVIIEQQNASSGMYAFGEGMEVLFLVALAYLLWPVGAGVVRWLGAKVAVPHRR